MLNESFGVAQQLLAATERQISKEVPADLMFESVGAARVIQELDPRVEVCGHRAREERVDGGHGVGAGNIHVVAADPDGISNVPQDLVCKALAEPPLQLELHPIVITVGGGSIYGDIAVSLLVIRSGGD